MERCLSLVLDKDGRISLTLEKMEARALDEYISKNFTSSEDIRKKYSKKIETYLSEHKNFIKEVEDNNGKRYAGSIVITELQDDLTIKKYKVLYKRDMRIFKEITNIEKFVLAVENRDYINCVNALKNTDRYSRIFSDYYGKELRFRCFTPSMFKRIVGSWRNWIKERSIYFEIVRAVLKEYDLRYKELKLDSPTVVYSKYLEEKKLPRKNKELEEEIAFLDNLQNDNQFAFDLLTKDDYKKEDKPTRYKTYADEEGYPGDLDDSYTPGQYSNVDELQDEEPFTNHQDLSELFKQSKEPIRYKTYADEDGYPGDLDDSYTPGQYSNMDELEDKEEIVEKVKTKKLFNNYE